MNNREKQLISLVVVLLVVLAMYYGLYRPLTNRKLELESEVASLTTTVQELRVEYEKMPVYKQGILDAEASIKRIQGKYPVGLSQESAFKLIFAIEDEFEDVVFENMSFSPLEVLSYSDENNDQATLRSVKQVLTSSLQLTYRDLKDYLSFMTTYEERTVLTNLNMSLNEEDGTINTSITMNQYAIVGGEGVYEVPAFDQVPTGKEVLFDAEGVEVQDEQPVLVRPRDERGDLLLTLKPVQADVEAQIIGLAEDDTQISFVKQDINDNATGILRIYQSEGVYYANYDIEGIYKEGNAFELGQVLEMDVYASDRIDELDLAALTLEVINETSATFYINMKQEDLNKPRLTVNVSQGKVIID